MSVVIKYNNVILRKSPRPPNENILNAMTSAPVPLSLPHLLVLL